MLRTRNSRLVIAASVTLLAAFTGPPRIEAQQTAEPRVATAVPEHRGDTPAEDRESSARIARTAAERQIATAREPFDFSYLAADSSRASEGIIAVRPAALATAESLRPWVTAINAKIAQTLKSFDVPPEHYLRLADIDQLVGFVDAEMKDPDGPPGARGSLEIGFSLLRSANPLNFKKLLAAVVPGAVEEKVGGIESVAIDALSYALLLPDERTLAAVGLASAAASVENVKQSPTGSPQHGASLFPHVSTADVALIVNTRREAWRDFAGVDPTATLILSRLSDFDAIAVGLDLTPRGVTIRGFAQLTEVAAEQAELDCLTQLDHDRRLALMILAEPADGEHAAMAAARKLLAGLETERQGRLVTWTSFLDWELVDPAGHPGSRDGRLIRATSQATFAGCSLRVRCPVAASVAVRDRGKPSGRRAEHIECRAVATVGNPAQAWRLASFAHSIVEAPSHACIPSVFAGGLAPVRIGGRRRRERPADSAW